MSDKLPLCDNDECGKTECRTAGPCIYCGSHETAGYLDSASNTQPICKACWDKAAQIALEAYSMSKRNKPKVVAHFKSLDGRTELHCQCGTVTKAAITQFIWTMTCENCGETFERLENRDAPSDCPNCKNP